jgi:hypothetical protein
MRMLSWRFILRDGTQVDGEYVGAQEGWIYVGTGESVGRLKQTDVVSYGPIPASEDDE